MTRNEIFLENQGMIDRIIRRNRTLLYALRLDLEDVYQELAIAALKAIDSFDPVRSADIRAHIWMQLQYAILDMKARQKPSGLTALCGNRPTVVSVEYAEEQGIPMYGQQPEQEPSLSPQLKQALSRLDESEREAVVRYLNGERPRKNKTFRSALGKLRGFYLDLEQGYAVCVG